MANVPQLSKGSVRYIYEIGQPQGEHVLQILDIRSVQSKEGSAQPVKQDRYRLVLSDGDHFIQAMLATQQNSIVPQIGVYSVVRVQECISNVVQNKRMVPVCAFPSKIGNPVSIDPLTAPSAGAASAGSSQPRLSYVPQLAQPATQPLLPQQHILQLQQHIPQPQLQPQQPASQMHYPAPQQSRPVAPVQVGSEDLTAQPIFPVRTLNPYQNKWVIKVRVTQKSDIREWSNAKGQGKLFSADLVDDEGGEIRMTGFQDSIDKFYGVLSVGQVYLISKGMLKFAAKRFTNIKHEYEITLKPDSVIQQIVDDGAIPKQKWDFIPIADISEKKRDDLVDVIGIITASTNVTKLTMKQSGQEISKKLERTFFFSHSTRTWTLGDNSGRSIEVTLWGDRADHLEAPIGTIVAVKAAKVSEYNQKSLSTTQSSVIMLSPDTPEAHTLRSWYDSQSGQVQLYSLSQSGAVGGNMTGAVPREEKYRTLAQIKEDQGTLSTTTEAEYYSVVATVTLIRHDGKFFYLACPTPDCGRKVTEAQEGFYCAKCEKSFHEPGYRYILTLTASDHTGSLWLSCFNDQGKSILNHEAKELVQLKDQKNEGQFEDIFKSATFRKFNFRLRGKTETYNNENRVKYTIIQATPVDWIADSRRLLHDIATYESMV